MVLPMMCSYLYRMESHHWWWRHVGDILRLLSCCWIRVQRSTIRTRLVTVELCSKYLHKRFYFISSVRTKPILIIKRPHTHMRTHVYSIQHNQFTWLVVTTNQLPPLSCGQLVHNRATSCTNVYLNILQAILPSWVGGPPLFIAVYPLIRVSVYSVSDDLCVYRMLCMSM